MKLLLKIITSFVFLVVAAYCSVHAMKKSNSLNDLKFCKPVSFSHVKSKTIDAFLDTEALQAALCKLCDNGLFEEDSQEVFKAVAREINNFWIKKIKACVQVEIRENVKRDRSYEQFFASVALQKAIKKLGLKTSKIQELQRVSCPDKDCDERDVCPFTWLLCAYYLKSVGIETPDFGENGVVWAL